MPAIVAPLILIVLAQAPQRDLVAAASRAGAISGRVVDANTAAPLRNARVGLVPEQGEEPDPVLTDGDGRFTIADVPPGRYTLTASKPGYVSLRYGARRALDRARPIEVPGDGAPIDVRLPRGAALSGRLVDDLGEPLQDVRVTAGVVVRTSAGVTMAAVRSADTDDRGEYRIAGLPAGTYVVSARPGPAIDGVTMVGMNLPPGAPTYERLYYPSTPGLQQARPVPLRAGDDLTDVDVTFRAVRAPRLTISVRDASGAPAAAFVSLASAEPFASVVQPADVDTRGTTTIPIDPGDWTLHARGDAGTAEVPLTVGEADAQVSIVLTHGTTISGRIAYEGGGRTPAAPLRFTEAGPLSRGDPFAPPVRVGPDGSFTITGVHDLRALRLDGLPAGWRLKGIFLDGMDLMASPAPAQSSTLSGVTIVVTAVHSEVSGTVVDEHGVPIPDAEVLIYPRDAALLVNADRWARWVRPDRHGAFAVRDLPSGSYFAVALADVDPARWATPEYLDALRGRAISFTLGDDERRMIAVPFSGGGGR